MKKNVNKKNVVGISRCYKKNQLYVPNRNDSNFL